MEAKPILIQGFYGHIYEALNLPANISGKNKHDTQFLQQNQAQNEDKKYNIVYCLSKLIWQYH